MTLAPKDSAAAKQRRISKGDLRKAAIIKAAMTIFARDGFAGASLTNVAKVAGLSTVGLLHHFPNKLALLQAVLTHRDEYVAGRLREADQDATLQSFMSFLKLIFHFSIEDASVSQALIIINTESLSVTHPANLWFCERFNIVHEHLNGHITRLVRAGEIRADVDVKQVALEVVSMMDGMQIQWLRSSGTLQIEAGFTRFLQRLELDLTRNP
jgi:AcrR family transcriptional regulator